MATSSPSPRAVRSYLIAHGLLLVVTAYFSVTYFHPDEHFQILEFAGYKLGTTTATELVWEFHDRMRAWFQPAAYYVIARAAQGLGIRDIFVIALLLRLASGLVAWVAVARIVRTSLGWSPDATGRLIQLRATTLLGFLPFLSVRTSAENVSGALFTIGFCTVLDALRPTALVRHLPARVGLAAGLLLGLSFECRFQTGILVAGLLAWLLFARRVRVPGVVALGSGIAVAILIGLLVDRWGYGEWTFPPYHYVRRNLFDDAARQFGTDPFLGYVYLLPSNIFAPVVIVLILALLLAWIRHPMHPVTWVTLPFAFVSSVLAHKEERFFFPMLLVSTTAVTLGLSPAPRLSALPARLGAIARRADAFAAGLWRRRGSNVAAFVVVNNLAGLLLLALYPLGWCANVVFYDYVYHHVEPGAHIYRRAGWSPPEYPFYRRFYWQVEPLADVREPAERVLRGEAAYFVTPLPYERIDAKDLGLTPRLVHSEFPGWQYPIVRGAAGPALEWMMRRLAPFPRMPKPKWLTLYRLESAGAPSAAADAR
jgi:GPI mannosyltransferase 3